jgi:hypothetical protein
MRTVTEPYSSPKRDAPSVGRRGRVGLLAVLLLLALIGGGVIVLAPKLPVFGSGSTALKISKVTVTVSPSTGHCPSAGYLFSAMVVTNGQGGPVTYKWTKPLGGDTATTTASLPSGQTEAPATLEFKFEGQGATEGDAVLHILSPTNIESAPSHITYQCP